MLALRYAARCEAAGRDHNEDNFLLDYNLNDDEWGFTTDEVIPLKGNGSILLVCDGMGGMNAGEVASAVAVATIKEWFDHTKLTSAVTASSKSIMEYIYNAIQAADAAIKADEAANPEHDGMGSTVVLAWMIRDKVYVGWCGDSRAYRFNPKSGLERLSHDHSYVQELVDAGKLTEELAFDHPNNNIITRSLGDPRGKAKPDVKEYDLYQNDIILLCSDGLCGCLRDNEIADIIANHHDTMLDCRDSLWEADEAAGWHDNVTITLAQVVSGGAAAPQKAASISSSKATLMRTNQKLKAIIICLIVLLLAGAGIGCWIAFGNKPAPEAPAEPVVTDSIVAPIEEEPEQAVEAPKSPGQKIKESIQRAQPNRQEAPAVAPKEETKPAEEEEIAPAAPRLTPVRALKEDEKEEAKDDAEVLDLKENKEVKEAPEAKKEEKVVLHEDETPKEERE